jgi:acetyltransferase
MVEQRRIKEMDINPLLVSSGDAVALDARIILYSRDVRDEDIPRSAIRPYPSEYVSRWTMENEIDILFRPIRSEDEPMMVKFHQTLSDESVYLRFFHMEKLESRIAHERLIQRCSNDYDREMALVAERIPPRNDEREILAVGRLSKARIATEAELAILVTDRYQGHGLGTELLRRLIRMGREERLSKIVAHILPENVPMRQMAKRFGFETRKSADPGIAVATLRL